MRQSDKNRAIVIFIALFGAALVMNCEGPTDPPEPYKLHFTPGTYEASAIGYNQQTPITVEVTFSEDAIETIEIVSHEESVDNEMAGNRVRATLDRVPPAIIEKQTLVLDAISGATARWTREGILKAVEDCVKQAGGNEAVAKLKESGTAKAITGYLGY
jgi:fumarate reductase flavoprotein subunit